MWQREELEINWGQMRTNAGTGTRKKIKKIKNFFSHVSQKNTTTGISVAICLSALTYVKKETLNYLWWQSICICTLSVNHHHFATEPWDSDTNQDIWTVAAASSTCSAPVIKQQLRRGCRKNNNQESSAFSKKVKAGLWYNPETFVFFRETGSCNCAAVKVRELKMITTTKRFSEKEQKYVLYFLRMHCKNTLAD